MRGSDRDSRASLKFSLATLKFMCRVQHYLPLSQSVLFTTFFMLPAHPNLDAGHDYLSSVSDPNDPIDETTRLTFVKLLKPTHTLMFLTLFCLFFSPIPISRPNDARASILTVLVRASEPFQSHPWIMQSAHEALAPSPNRNGTFLQCLVFQPVLQGYKQTLH